MTRRSVDHDALPSELRDLWDSLAATDALAEEVVAGLSEELGTRPPGPGSWSVSECLDHLATGNASYLRAMSEAARRGRARGRLRRRPVRPGLVGGLFISLMEPSTGGRIKMKSPAIMRPRVRPLAAALDDFLTSQDEARRFLLEHADLDLAGVGFRNPFVRGVRFSLVTGLHVIAAHDRRHLLQARRARHSVDPDF